MKKERVHTGLQLVVAPPQSNIAATSRDPLDIEDDAKLPGDQEARLAACTLLREAEPRDAKELQQKDILSLSQSTAVVFKMFQKNIQCVMTTFGASASLYTPPLPPEVNH